MTFFVQSTQPTLHKRVMKSSHKAMKNTCTKEITTVTEVLNRLEICVDLHRARRKNIHLSDEDSST